MAVSHYLNFYYSLSLKSTSNEYILPLSKCLCYKFVIFLIFKKIAGKQKTAIPLNYGKLMVEAGVPSRPLF